jgi:uncharacterized protein (TIGR02466 family)
MTQNLPRIETWFPKLIYLVDGICLNLLSKFENNIKKDNTKTKRSQTLNVDSTHLINRLLHQQDEYKILVNEIESHSRIFLSNMGYSDKYVSKCFISSMWYNISNKDDFLFPHTHPGSIMSGAFYVKTVKENSVIFYDDLTSSYEPPSEITNLSMTTCTYPCIPGRLILFRSNFIHATPKQLEDGEKIVISFNINYFDR